MAQNNNPLYPPWFTKEDIQKSINDLNEFIIYKSNINEKKKRSCNNEYNFTPFDVSSPTINKNSVSFGSYSIERTY